jgi:GNAT superfamily N-acetyltransferase
MRGVARRAGRVEIREEPLSALAEHAKIPIAFEVDRVLDVDALDPEGGRCELVERALAEPWVKDYDALGNRPTDWARSFDVSRWGLLSAWVEGRRAGGAVIAFATPGLHVLGGREDLAVVWDLRVSPELRGRGVGSALFAAAENWARARGCRELEVETQHVNVPACRFYARQGCTLRAVHRLAYPELPGEVQLLWGKDLSSRPEGS